MLNKKVIHKTLGEGVIVKFEDNIATVKFSERTLDFRYPDAFSKYIALVDAEAQNEVKALADEVVAKKEAEERAKAEAKAEEVRRHYARMISEENKKRKISAAEFKNKSHGNLAFKANFCDGGCSESCVGFKGVCSPEQIKYNIEKETGEILYEKAYAEFYLRKYEEAKSYITQALEKDINIQKYLLLLGNIYLQINQDEQALNILNKLDNNSSFDFLTFSGLVKQRYGEYKEAIQCFLQAAKKTDNEGKCYYNCASTYFKMNDISSAKKYYNLAKIT